MSEAEAIGCIAAKMVDDLAAEIAGRRQREIWEFYWRSDIPTNEIGAAYGIRASHVWRVAGPAQLAEHWCRCGGPLIVRSRTELNGRFPPRVCEECAQARERQRRDEWKRQREAVDERREWLRTMPYREYLQTPEWQSTRSSALQRAGHQCQLCCSSGKLHVHHRTYARRGAEWARDLIVLCADCHSTFHENLSLAERGRADASAIYE